MSVPKNKRSEATATEFFTSALNISDKITKELINDFGIKNISGNLKVFTNKAKMEEADSEILLGLVTKYGITLETDVKYWLLEHYRERILCILDNAIENITNAYTIYPNSMDEFNMKRRIVSQAIANFNLLKQTFQTAIRILPINLEKYMPYVKDIDSEISKLKAWRKDNNKFKKSCCENDEKARFEADKEILSHAIQATKEYRSYNVGLAAAIESPNNPNSLVNRIKAITAGQRLFSYNKDQDIMDYAYTNWVSNKYSLHKDEQGKIYSDVLIPALILCDEHQNPIKGA
jgi:hypothetical protein